MTTRLKIMQARALEPVWLRRGWLHYELIDKGVPMDYRRPYLDGADQAWDTFVHREFVGAVGQSAHGWMAWPHHGRALMVGDAIGGVCSSRAEAALLLPGVHRLLITILLLHDPS